MKPLSALVTFLFSLGLHANATTTAIKYPDIAGNVPYSEVVTLPFHQPAAKFSYGDDPLQYGLLWKAQSAGSDKGAKTRQADKPLIVFIHGGCWLNAYDIKHSYALTSALAQAGYPVWSVEYRRTGDEGGGWPGTFADIQASLHAVKNLHKHGLDTTSVVLMGHSAGGHLAVLAGINKDALPMNIEAVVGLAAITDVARYAKGNNSCQKATVQFMGGKYEEMRETYDSANPARQKVSVTTYLLHGDQDSIVPLEHTQLDAAQAEIVSGAGHFDWIHPGSEAFKRILKVLDNLSSNSG